MIEKIFIFFAKFSFGIDKRLQFYEKIQAYSEDNISPYDALMAMHERYNVSGNILKNFTSDILKKMNGGLPLSAALDGWVPKNDLVLIRAGEETDNISGALKEVIKLTRDSRRLTSEIKSNLIPSVFHLLMLFGVIYGFSVGVVPDLKSGFNPDNISNSTRNYFAFVDWIVDNMAYIGGISVLFIVFSWLSLSRMDNIIRYKVLDKLPPWSIYKKIQSGYFLINFSSMLRAGVSPIKSLEDMSELSNPYLKRYLKQMIVGISSGKKEGDALNIGFIPNDMMNDIIDYGRLSSFAVGIQRIGERSIEETSKFLNKFSSLFKNLIFLGFALFLMFTMSSILSMVDLDKVNGF